MMSEMGHNEAARLLPWLVNGTLGEAERERLERHVHACLVCRAELREQQALQVLVRQRPDVPLSAERSFEAFTRRLHEVRREGEPAEREHGASEASPDSRSARPAHAQAAFGQSAFGSDPMPRSSRIPRRRLWASGPRRFVLALRGSGGGEGFQLRLAAAAGMAIVAVGLLLWLGLRVPAGQEGAYRTLSAQQAPAGAKLDIVFSPAVTQQGMRDVLSGVNATIVNGPSAIGRYTIKLGAAGSSAPGVDAALRKLRADQRVRFAARSYISGSSAAPASGRGDSSAAPAKESGAQR